jgi:hypothetical protein
MRTTFGASSMTASLPRATLRHRLDAIPKTATATTTTTTTMMMSAMRMYAVVSVCPTVH